MLKTKTKKLSVNVTAHDIKRGVRRSTRYCPIARAIRRATDYKKHVVVCTNDVVIEHAYSAPLPKKAQNFIGAFDFRVAKVKPFRFVLNVSAK